MWCTLDDVIVKVTETDDKKKHGIKSDSEKTIDSWNEKFPWLIVAGEGHLLQAKCSYNRANEGYTHLQEESINPI